MAQQTLHLKIIDAEKVQFEGEVVAVSSFNDSGPFDILPFHANFISIIKKNVVVHLPDRQKKEFPITTAVLKAFNNSLMIYLGIEEFKLETISSTGKPGPQVEQTAQNTPPVTPSSPNPPAEAQHTAA